jgi:phosphate-selective porin OprO/OprP
VERSYAPGHRHGSISVADSLPPEEGWSRLALLAGAPCGGNLLFVERAAPTLLVPNRDVGVQLRGEVFDNRLEYQLGVFNGVADAGSGDLETSDDEKDIVARFFAQPFKNSDHPWLRGIGFGLAGTFGNQEGALRTFVSPGQQRIFNYRSGAGTNAATANVVADGDHWRLAPQFWYYKGPFGLFGEYVISDQIVRRDAGVATFGDLRHSAWQVAASYFLTGEENSFGRINILKPFTIGGDGWGAWEVAARVHRLDVDNKAFPLFANPSNSATETLSWTLGLNWHLNRFFKFNLNYEQTDFTGGDASPLLKKGEKVILTRAQVSF